MTKKKKPAARKMRVKRLPGQHPKNCLCPYHCEERRAAWRAGHPPAEAPAPSMWSDGFVAFCVGIAGLGVMVLAALDAAIRLVY